MFYEEWAFIWCQYSLRRQLGQFQIFSSSDAKMFHRLNKENCLKAGKCRKCGEPDSQEKRHGDKPCPFQSRLLWYLNSFIRYSGSSSLKGWVTTSTVPFPTLTAPFVAIFVVLVAPLTVHLTGVVTTLVAMHPKLNKRQKRKMENDFMPFMSTIPPLPPKYIFKRTAYFMPIISYW